MIPRKNQSIGHHHLAGETSGEIKFQNPGFRYEEASKVVLKPLTKMVVRVPACKSDLLGTPDVHR